VKACPFERCIVLNPQVLLEPDDLDGFRHDILFPSRKAFFLDTREQGVGFVSEAFVRTG
jgi:hypothetical protein